MLGVSGTMLVRVVDLVNVMWEFSREQGGDCERLHLAPKIVPTTPMQKSVQVTHGHGGARVVPVSL